MHIDVLTVITFYQQYKNITLNDGFINYGEKELQAITYWIELMEFKRVKE